MRRFLVLVGLLAGGAANAQPPRFVVENKVPAFTVVNNVPAAPALPTDPTKPAPPGYQWQKVGAEPWKLVAVPGVAAVPTFRNAGFHSGHQCPQCGRTQTTISGFNRDGTHNHTCAYDGTTWRH